MTEPLIEVRNLKKVFRTRSGTLTALEDINLKIMPGEVVAIIGSSGSGKSTLLRCMNLLIEPSEGYVSFDGQVIYNSEFPVDVKIDDVRKNIGMVFQQFNLFMHLTVKANISLPLKRVMNLSDDEIKSRVEKVLNSVNLSDKINSFPGELSGGQQQRVAIARVLAMRPKLIFFDEPTSALDPELTGEVLDVMKRLVTEFHYTLVVVSHEIPFAKEVASRIVFMDEAKILYQGGPDTLDNPPNDRLRQFLSKILSAR
ncbi:MAG: amino acid ABC transporter ATP-binding protein [Candidatus Heimdallarchaeota archaeon]|nr:amino acid ABC transporter ATP-binding protein [Candidatus Heimdallarchaeota archaeon]